MKKGNKSKLSNSTPITIIYLLSTGIVTILSNINYNDNDNENKEYLLNNMKLDYNKIIKKYELWRLITTFLYIGKPSPNLIFNYYIYYKRMISAEKKFTKNKKLSEFIMMLLYLMVLSHICNFFAIIFFNLKPKAFLSHQLMFSIILINSKRDPEKMFRFYFAKIPNKFVPYFLFTMRSIKNGRIIKNLISFIPGLGYYYLKDVFPNINKNIDILVTPKALEVFCKKFFYKNYYLKKKKIKDKRVNENNSYDNNNINDNDNFNKKINDAINENEKNEKLY